MKKLLLFFIITLSTAKLYSQNTSDTLYHYTFKLQNIDNIGLAKHSINSLRKTLGETLITFNDDTDTFLLKSHHYFTEIELFTLIENSGFLIQN